MCFNAERRAVERRARADVCNGAVTARLAFDASARDVDAASGKKFLFRDEVQGREGKAAARSRAADDFSGEGKGPAQKTRGVGHVAFGDFAADDGAGNDLAAIDHRGNDHHVEAVFLAKLCQQFYIAGLLMAKPEIFADENGFTMQIADENLLDKFAGGEPRELES